MKKIIAWKNKHTGEQGHGMPIEEDLANVGAEIGNIQHPDIIHQVIDMDIKKWKVITDEK